MIRIFGHQHVRDSCLRGQSDVDQSGSFWCLRYAVSSDTAGIIWTTSNDNAELRRDNIQSFGHVLTDTMQGATTVADQAVRLDGLLDTRKVNGKRAGGAWPGLRLTRGAIGFILGMNGRDGRCQVLQCEIKLHGIGLLGFAVEGCLL